MTIKQKPLIALLFSFSLMYLTGCEAETPTDGPLMTVYKSPTCQCCARWVEHMEAAGFTVEVQNRRDLGAVKQELGVQPALGSCHTAVTQGYVIEGHVPAAEVHRLLREHPDATGLSVPGMPIGSPGMEQGSRQDPYEVLLFSDGASPQTYATYPTETHSETRD